MRTSAKPWRSNVWCQWIWIPRTMTLNDTAEEKWLWTSKHVKMVTQNQTRLNYASATRRWTRLNSTQPDKTMTDRYGCDLYSNWTQKVIGTWPIDMGVALTQTNMENDRLIWVRSRLKLNTKSDRNMVDRYRCGPESNWHGDDRKMVDRYRCDPNSNWQNNDRSI